MKRALMIAAGAVVLLHGLARPVLADTLTLYNDLLTYQNALTSLGLVEEVIDFESLPDGTPVGAGDVFRPSPEVFDLFGGTNSASFSAVRTQFVYEDFDSVSPTHSLREDASRATTVSFASPVAAVGVFALDIDNLVADAATAVYSSTTLANVAQSFDNTGGSQNNRTFFGAIATNDAMTSAVPILTRVVYDQSNASTPEFTYLDDFRVAPIPEPSALAIAALGGMIVAGFRRTARTRRRQTSRMMSS